MKTPPRAPSSTGPTLEPTPAEPPRCLARGARCPARGARCPARGARCLARGARAVFAGGLLLGAVGCVESAAYERVTVERDAARSAFWQRDRQIQQLQWQTNYLGQQLQQLQQRDEASRQELTRKLDELKAQNRALSEQLTRAESQRAEPPPAAAAEPAGGKKRADGGGKPERAQSAQNAQILDALSRIEKLIHERENKPDHSSDPTRRVDDILDPWNFGDRR